MYYPFLKARQFELIALRELASENVTQGHVIPILEPVKETLNNLILANTVFREKNQSAYLVLNSNIGSTAGDTSFFIDFIASEESTNYLPAFHYNSNKEYIIKIINQFSLSDCMLICGNDVSSDDPNFRELCELSEVKIINVEDPGRNRDLNRYIRNLNKTYIRLDDPFEKISPNAEYLKIEENRFSEEHIHFRDENYQGFSDYTTLPSLYTEGGSAPRAVVIHLTYKKPDNKIWIKHFTSNTNDSIANVQGKFAEASKKAVEFCRSENKTNSAIAELESYYDEQHYPGLGMVKKISIKNHILVVAEFLKNQS